MPESHSRRDRILPADQSKQKPNHSYTPITQYEDKRIPCADCGKMLRWTAQQQQTWYEEMKASIHASVNLRCETCRKRGRHDWHKQAQRKKQRRRDA